MTIVRAAGGGRAGELARDLLRRVAPFDPAVGGWATRSLSDALRRVFLTGSAGWQVVMLAAVLAARGPVSDLLPLLVAHAVMLVLVLVARGGGVPMWVTVAGIYVLFVADWAAADSMDAPLLFAACWMVNLGAAMPAFVLRGRTAVVLPAVAAVLMPAAMLVLRPDLPGTLPVAVFVATSSIVLATRVGYSYLFDFVTRADEQAAVAIGSRRPPRARRRPAGPRPRTPGSSTTR